MTRSSALLIVLAFAFGLWLGFDPEAHAITERTWEQIKTAFADLVEQAAAETQEPVSQEPGIPNTGEEPRPNETLDQISAALRDLWESIKAFWRDLVNNAPNTNTEPTQ